MKKRDKEIISFICGNYCQTCDNSRCNVEEIMEKYQSNWLTPTQMEEVNEFQLDTVSCKKHIPNEGFQMLGHLIEIHYMDGRVEKKKGWYTTKAISDLWVDDVEYVDLLFSDI
ncbi:hypothetical protein C4E24_08770 [ANME-1 cluster archaeon AG-394-G21]|nr:hypothetical protein [ANME-1 cluster archaeon AG-394-G21]